MPFLHPLRQLIRSQIFSLSLCFFLLNLPLFAQTPGARQEMVFTTVENPPAFPGGPAALIDYMRKNVNYPPEARKADVKGNVYANFIVETDGSITDVQVLKGLGDGCYEEAVRVIEAMPKW